MLSNAYFLAKFRFDTAENEPAKKLRDDEAKADKADQHPETGNSQAFAHLVCAH